MKKILTLLTISTLTLSGVAVGGYLLTNNLNQVLSTNNYQKQKQKETNPQLKEKQHVYDKHNPTKVLEIGWKTLDNGTVRIQRFKKNTTEVPVELPPWITSLYGAFGGLESSSVKNLDKWNTSSVTDMGAMFGFAKSFNQPLNNWKTENVVDMNHMFFWASSFNQDISMWNTSNVTNMERMFSWASSFNQDISMWDVGKVTKWDNFGWGIFSSKLWQIPEKFRNYNPNNTKTLSIVLGIIGGIAGIGILGSAIYLYKRKKSNQ
ncbi:BspA family leucine-rich repeat surface protein [Mycoplasma sp. 06067-C1-B144P-99-0482-3]|uniref:BspA family leucine-rich repeat surface protein n=1 Tax=Mycoplasma sp. 06067-C1-B144P-99-0482-3 TaxID=3117438 RepID=UPI003DA573AD